MQEEHYNNRIGWLRASVLGANDGIVSTSSLVVGIAAASPERAEVLLAAIAGLVAGAMSMAAGEYVSVSSQADTENADIERERLELEQFPTEEHEELAEIYRQRGLDNELADEVATQLMAHNALEAHIRDELGLTEQQKVRSVVAALSSAASFTLGAIFPVLLAAFVPMSSMILAVFNKLAGLTDSLGFVAAKAGGASQLKGATRVTFWGALAMAATIAIGHAFGAVS